MKPSWKHLDRQLRRRQAIKSHQTKQVRDTRHRHRHTHTHRHTHRHTHTHTCAHTHTHTRAARGRARTRAQYARNTLAIAAGSTWPRCIWKGPAMKRPRFTAKKAFFLHATCPEETNTGIALPTVHNHSSFDSSCIPLERAFITAKVVGKGGGIPALVSRIPSPHLQLRWVSLLPWRRRGTGGSSSKRCLDPCQASACTAVWQTFGKNSRSLQAPALSSSFQGLSMGCVSYASMHCLCAS